MITFRLPHAVGLIGLGIILGTIAPWSLYTYGQAAAGPYRVNRLTGVQQFATGKGWATTGEIDARVDREDRRVEAEIAPEIARFGTRLAEMRIAARDGRLRKVDVFGRSVSAYFTDGHKESYYALGTDDPRLQDAEAIAQRVSLSGATAGSTTAGPPVE